MPRLWPVLALHFPDDRETVTLRDRAVAALDDFQPTALTESNLVWRVYFVTDAERDRAGAALEQAFGLDGLAVSHSEESDEDWARRSQEGLEPVRVGQLLILPSAVRAPSPESRIPIVIEPSMGFGTGHHASTRLCLRLLQRLDVAGAAVVDIGTGSGILAIAAALLGAARGVGIDVDPDAVDAAQRNLALNPGAQHVAFQVDDVRTMSAAPAGIVFGNLTGAFLVKHAGALIARLAPGGHCILSGILAVDEQAVRRAFDTLTLVERLQEEEWVGLLLKDEGASSGPDVGGSLRAI